VSFRKGPGSASLHFDRDAAASFSFSSFGSGRNRRPRDSGGESDSLSVLEIGIDGSDHNTSFDSDQIDANKRYANPGIDYDAFVQDAIKYVN